MTRPLRIEYSGAFYHTLARGQRSDPIFYSDKDREKFIYRLQETVQKYHIRIHTYVLMDNHYHLLIETPHGNLSKAMHYFNSSYTNWFRIKHQLVGSLFQGRYKSILVDKDAYLLELSAYIHLNPVRAGITKTPEEFAWSSYACFSQKKESDFPYTREIRAVAGGRKAYLNFVSSRIDALVDRSDIYGKNSILGGEKFILNSLNRFRKIKTCAESVSREVGDLKRLRKMRREDIVFALVDSFSVDEKKVFEKKRGNIYWKLYLYGLKKYTDMSLKEIGELAGLDYAAISVLVRRFEQESETKKELSKKIAVFEASLKRNV